tara:strand:+ start:201 stop:626 length:426 start_codon:yes stop_codon:yes gene_type:complete
MDQRPVYLDLFKAKVEEINKIEETLTMSFEASSDFCHTGGRILQGGFVATMLDCSMAFLAFELTDYEKSPMTIDMNINYLSSGAPGRYIAKAKVTKIGKSIGFLSSELFQDDKLIASATCTAKMADINKKYLKQMRDTVRK